MASSGLNTAVLRDAVRAGATDVLEIAREVGSSAARLGIPFHEVLDQVEQAYAPDAPDFAAVRAIAVAWAEAALVHHADIACADPLTSLATVPHLRSRLDEIYRGAERAGKCAGEVSALVVVELPRSRERHALEEALRALDVAEVLRLVFTGEETCVQMTPRRFAVLATHECIGDSTMGLLARMVERMLDGGGQPRLWIERLPSSADGIGQVVAGLCE